MAIKVTLVRSMSGHTESHRETLRGLGLTSRGMTRIVEDTPAIRGMVEKVGYLLAVEETKEPFVQFGRRFRAKAQREASAKAKAAKS
jgi:large subunit ribosomal protein L30